MATLHIPDVLKPYTNVSQLDVHINSLDQLPSWLSRNFPKLYAVLFLNSRLNGFVNLYLGDRSVSQQLSEAIKLNQSSNLKLVTSISGG